MTIKKKDLLSLYNLPKKVFFCKKCTISNQRPRITFDKNGVCSACNFTEYKKKIDWKLREQELQILCDKYRKNNGEYDVIVPCSGGKDGSFVAHQLKTVYGMNPLAVTWSPLIYTDIGRINLDNFIKSGFNHILGTPNPEVSKRLIYLAFKEMGDPFQPFIYGQANFPLHIAQHYNVKLVFYGENGEVEYGGDMKNANKPNRTISDQTKHYFSGYDPDYWKNYNICQKDLYPYFLPNPQNFSLDKFMICFFSYFKFWDPQENFYYAQKYCNFKVNEERSQGTFSKYASLDDKLDGFHYYLSYIKFGIGRCTSDASHEIRDEKINREEGIELIKRYDGEFPQKYFEEFIDYIGIKEGEFFDIVDSWRSDHLWINDNKKWKLKNPIYS